MSQPCSWEFNVLEGPQFCGDSFNKFILYGYDGAWALCDKHFQKISEFWIECIITEEEFLTISVLGS